MRLIDADALGYEVLEEYGADGGSNDVNVIYGMIINAPTVDRPQGKWIKRFGMINCSVCKHSNWSDSFEHTVRRFKFCPNCGARMKGASDDA